MILQPQTSQVLGRLIDHLAQAEYSPRYRRGWVDAYTGKEIAPPKQLTEQEKVGIYPVKTFIPDPQTLRLYQQIDLLLRRDRTPHKASHGFEQNRNRETWLLPHRRHGKMFRILLEDGFRYFGKKKIRLLCKRLLGLTNEQTDYLADFLTVRGELLQGHGLSSQFFNMQAYKMDCYLTDFCHHHQLTYTRFLDQLIFSSSLFIPAEVLGRLKRIVSRSGWVIADGQFVTDLETMNPMQTASSEVAASRTEPPLPELSASLQNREKEKKLLNLLRNKRRLRP
jgi:hypothetical protein